MLIGKTRQYQREYARRKRRMAWVAKALDCDLCPAMLGNGKPCRWPLENRKVHGATVPFCAQCDRKARGICIDCKAAPVDGAPRKALRCGGCKKLERGAAELRWRKRHPGKVKAQWWRRKRRLLADPAAYRAMLERKRLWRLASPSAKRRYAAQWSKSDSAKAYFKAYREARRVELAKRARQYAAAKAAGAAPTHPCVACSTPISGRAKKCAPCRETTYRAARTALSQRAA